MDMQSETTTDVIWRINLETSAKKLGGRIHIISDLTVDYAKSHNEAAMAGGPQTPPYYNVLKVADKYQSLEAAATNKKIILFNWLKNGGNYIAAVKWGLENKLHLTNPHVVFTIGKSYPRLNYELGSNPLYVVETTGCTSGIHEGACCMWWKDVKRESRLEPQGSFGYRTDWFAFEATMI